MDIKVCDLPIPDRPLYRIAQLGGNYLTNIELLSLIIGTENSLTLAQNLIIKFESLENIKFATIEQLTTVKGIGKSLAGRIIACLEISKRLKLIHSPPDSSPITTPEQCFMRIKNKITDYFKEHFFVCSIDIRNRLISVDEVSTGTLTASLVHPREVFEVAIKRHSAQIIVVHNHPSGEADPSEDDIRITKRLYEAGKIMGIELIDHLIITETGFASLKDKGII